MEQQQLKQMKASEDIAVSVSNHNTTDAYRASVNSLGDHKRVDEPWSHKIEELFQDINNDLNVKIEKHDRSGYHFKKMDARWGYPGILLAGVMVPISALMDPCGDNVALKVTNAIAYASIAIFTATSQYFNYGKKAQRHFDISARYGDVLTDIRIELVKKPQYRQSADTFLQRIQMRIDGLNNSAPVIPQHIAYKE